MKFIKNTAPEGVLLPPVILKLCKFQDGDNVDLYPAENTLVILKGRMTAPELLDAAQELSWLFANLLNELSETCGPCTDCEYGDTDVCPYNSLGGEPVRTNDFLLQDAGIPEGAKLCAEVDEENHTVTISAAEHRHDLSDLPDDLLETFAMAGTCLRALEEHLIREDIVYGN